MGKQTYRLSFFGVKKRLCRTSLPADEEEVVSFSWGTEAELGSEGTGEGEQKEQRQLRSEELLNRVKVSSDDVVCIVH